MEHREFLEQWKYYYWYMLLYINIMWYCKWVPVIITLSKPIECETPRMNPNVHTMDFEWLWFVVGGSLIVTNVPFW